MRNELSGLEFFLVLASAAAVMLMLNTLQPSQADATSLAPVVWNSTNPIFKSSKNDHVIEVKLFDDIDFVCPYFDTTEDDSSLHEYLTIYMVGRSEYEDCIIHPHGSATPILNCSNPNQRKRFTILFEPFQSIPNAQEYHPGASYYYITTSTGKSDGLDNLNQGACLQRNMKLTIRVCCQTSATREAVDEWNRISETPSSLHIPKQTTRKDDGPSGTGRSRPRPAELIKTRTTNRPQGNESEDRRLRHQHQRKTVIHDIQLQTQPTDGNLSRTPQPEDEAVKPDRLFSASGRTEIASMFQSRSSAICLLTSLMTVYYTHDALH